MHISSCISIHQCRLVHRNYFRVLFDALTYTNVDKIKDTILKTLQSKHSPNFSNVLFGDDNF